MGRVGAKRRGRRAHGLQLRDEGEDTEGEGVANCDER